MISAIVSEPMRLASLPTKAPFADYLQKIRFTLFEI